MTDRLAYKAKWAKDWRQKNAEKAKEQYKKYNETVRKPWRNKKKLMIDKNKQVD